MVFPSGKPLFCSREKRGQEEIGERISYCRIVRCAFGEKKRSGKHCYIKKK